MANSSSWVSRVTGPILQSTASAPPTRFSVRPPPVSLRWRPSANSMFSPLISALNTLELAIFASPPSEANRSFTARLFTTTRTRPWRLCRYKTNRALRILCRPQASANIPLRISISTILVDPWEDRFSASRRPGSLWPMNGTTRGPLYPFRTKGCRIQHFGLATSRRP